MADGDPSSESQLIYLRGRVKQLELENETLRRRASSCQCSKEEVPRVVCEASSFEKKFPELESKWDVQGGDSTANGHHEKDSAKSKEETGCSLRALNQCNRRYVAVKVMYFGPRFHGFASEAQSEPTIESEFFRALKRTNLLIGGKEEWKYSRCGRTDKGVSSTGQVISMFLRSNFKGMGEEYDTDESTSRRQDYEQEIDYVKVLNRVLPEDIRVLGWCPVSIDFHARFTCLSREYRYLFWRGSLDVVVMQEAARKFIGMHDFRNFCKMDAANVSNFRRQITSFEISSCNKRLGEDELWAMTIRGSAFLWHQVRCIVAVLFMIGQGLESEEVIDLLLDTEKTPRKPQYNLASELPLILRYCEFEYLSFICSSDARRSLLEHLDNEFKRHAICASIFQEALGCLCASVHRKE